MRASPCVSAKKKIFNKFSAPVESRLVHASDRSEYICDLRQCDAFVHLQEYIFVIIWKRATCIYTLLSSFHDTILSLGDIYCCSLGFHVGLGWILPKFSDPRSRQVFRVREAAKKLYLNFCGLLKMIPRKGPELDLIFVRIKSAANYFGNVLLIS